MEKEQTHRHTCRKAEIRWDVLALMEHTYCAREAGNFSALIMYNAQGGAS